MPSALATIFAGAESNYGAAAGRQPASMIDPTYGQYSGFVNQYGSGAAGVDNYAQQVIAANPNASIGDVYAGYFANTGTPGSAYNSFSTLSAGGFTGPGLTYTTQTQAARNITNVAAANGYDVNAPAASLYSGAYTPSSPDTTGMAGAGTDGIDTTGITAPDDYGMIDDSSFSSPTTIGASGLGPGSGGAGVTASDPYGLGVGTPGLDLPGTGGGYFGGGASSAGDGGYLGGGSSAGTGGSGAVTVSGGAGTSGGPDATSTSGSTSTAPPGTSMLDIVGAVPTALSTGLAAIGQNINNAYSTAVNQATTGLGAMFANATNLFERGALIFFGILLVVVALAMLGLHGAAKSVSYATDGRL